MTIGSRTTRAVPTDSDQRRRRARPIGAASRARRPSSAHRDDLRVGTPGLQRQIEEIDLAAGVSQAVLWKFIDRQAPRSPSRVAASNGMRGNMAPRRLWRREGLEIVPLAVEIRPLRHEPNPLVESTLDMLKA